ncbi:RNA polymerase sigma factor [Prevotella dentasini]|uniref:RNA polymerase sigma factor n=1 Tax=Prevotella dentasini TaxID=589537 RepID=UPI000467F668|nr:sigma-70 family RNA polymerase sigma factor [Prevotella dentasini]
MKPKQDEQTFARLVREHKSTIYTVCYMFSKNEDEVNDLFQEVLVNLWKGLPGFKGDSDVRTWIYRVSLNTCISCDRKKRKRKSVPLSIDINPFTDSDEDSRQVQQLNRRISQLGPFDRAIILLWLENMSYEEIGQVVGISTKNVSVRLYRIKEKLKNSPAPDPVSDR